MLNHQSFLESWSQAVIDTNYDAILAHYDGKAVLLPTLSGVKRDTPEALLNYFEHFSPKVKDAKWHWADSFLQNIADGRIIVSGEYTFYLVDGTDTTARFTYVLEEQSESFKILHHHSSLLPE